MIFVYKVVYDCGHFRSTSSSTLYYYLYCNYYRKMKIYITTVSALTDNYVSFSRNLSQRLITIECSGQRHCKSPIRKFWPAYHHKNVLYFVSRSHVITSASRAKEPLVSQLLHSEQAPKWCLIISAILVRLCFQSCSSNQPCKKKNPILIKFKL